MSHSKKSVPFHSIVNIRPKGREGASVRFHLLAFLLALLAVQEARSSILDFNLPSSETIYTSAEVDGFLITSEHFHLFGDGYFASNGTTYLSYEAGRGRPFTISRVGGGTFSLRGLDGAEAVTTSPVDRPSAEAIEVLGYRADGTTVSMQMQLDGVHDGGAHGSGNDFQSFSLPESFSNLTAVYFQGIRADGRDGGIAVDNLNIDTGEVPSDSVPPTVSMTSPVAGGVAGTITLAATATDTNGVVGVQFRVDGVNLGAEVLLAPYSITLNTATLTNGTHTITAVARDTSNNVGTSSVVVDVANSSVSGVPYYLNFDGADDYLEVADSDSLSFGNGATDTPLSVELWFRPESMTLKQNLVGKWGTSNTTREYKLYLAAGTIRLDLMDGARQAIVSAYTSGSQTALTGGWHHLAITYDGRGGATAANGITIFVDGVAVPIARISNASYTAMSNTSAALQIGREAAASKHYFGGLDEIRLWRVLRTPADIQSHMRSELLGSESGLLAYWKLNEGGGGVVADSSLSGNVANLRNGPTWTSGGSVNPPVLDSTPPQISNVVVSDITDTGVTIAFVTDELATGSVFYAANGACPCGEVYGGSGRTAHSVRLNGLSQDTSYEFEAKAIDAAGNTAIGSTRTFRTLAAPPDTVGPVVTITSPTVGAVAGTILLAATATDANGVVGVQFKLDGVSYGAEDLSPPYSIAWDTTTVANGTHTITAEARDVASNIGVSSIIVSSNNGSVSSDPYYLSFDGLDDYVEVADSAGLSFGNGVADAPLTIEMWFRPSSMTLKQNLVGKWGSANASREFKLYLAAGTIRLDLMDSASQAIVSAYSSGSQTALTGGWHHLAVTYDGRGGASAANGITIYVDGVAMAVTRVSSSAYVSMSDTSAQLQIGRESAATKQYYGSLDEIRLWRTVRTLAQIQSSMRSELVGSELGLQTYWKLNEGGGGVIDDTSSSGIVGILRNNPTWYQGGAFAP